MTSETSEPAAILIRPMHYHDLTVVDQICMAEPESVNYVINSHQSMKALSPWHSFLRLFGLLCDSLRQHSHTYLAERNGLIQGMIRVAPFNRSRSTWRIEQVVIRDTDAGRFSEPAAIDPQLCCAILNPLVSNIGSHLLRHCFERIVAAQAWLSEVDVNDKNMLALYRQNGFQPLAQMTYWEIAPALLQDLAEHEPDLPDLSPVSNADARLLCQLDTTAMPPLVRQVFNRHDSDFKTSLLGSLILGVKNWLNHVEVVSGYVFEPQRQVAIGSFQLQLCRDGSQPHQAQLTVHPAYTWLYPELMAQMARIIQDVPTQSLHLASSDYQPEREDYLEQIGAQRIAHTLMMSRWVWHKMKESKTTTLDLQLADMLQGFQPARKPVPGRISLLRSPKSHHPADKRPEDVRVWPLHFRQRQTRRPAPTDFSDPSEKGPWC